MFEEVDLVRKVRETLHCYTVLLRALHALLLITDFNFTFNSEGINFTLGPLKVTSSVLRRSSLACGKSEGYRVVIIMINFILCNS